MCATNGPNVVSLVITFPAHYPNQAIPSFEFTSDTSIDTNTKTKLMKVRFLVTLWINRTVLLHCVIRR